MDYHQQVRVSVCVCVCVCVCVHACACMYLVTEIQGICILIGG